MSAQPNEIAREEIAREQKYFDAAEEQWKRWVAEAAVLAEAAADPATARALKKLSKKHIAQFTQSTAVAVGRTDGDDGETVYIGRQLIRDVDGEVLVVSWQAPAALPYHQASLKDPRGLARRRTFRCEGNTILDFTDVLFGTPGAQADEALLAELARRRDGSMRDIVATIQSAQFDLIRAPFDQVLVIEGGPGTGKTAIALHRVSWMLYHDKDLRSDDVLVIGPSPAFMRYISTVLPALGEADVPLRELGRLGPEVQRGRAEKPEVAKLKGDPRMAGLIARGLDARIGVPEAAERLQVDGRYVNLPGADIAKTLEVCRTAQGTYSERRKLFRERLTELIARRIDGDPGRAADGLVDRLWPQVSAAAFVRDLLGSRNRLATAAGSEFDADEIALLHRRSAARLTQETWSDADIPLLDEAEALITASQPRYAHIVVDEVQDLSPMQLRAIARRSRTGSLTICGDLAQATGPWAADSWDQITAALSARGAASITNLRYGYRVPRQVVDFAAPLLPAAAPGAGLPEAVQVGPEEPSVHRVDAAERAGRVAAAALMRSTTATVGVICPDRCRREVEAALTAKEVTWSEDLGGPVTLVSPRGAKGLEFEAVIVVEPEAIVEEDERGQRMLYVALTRATRTLDVVASGEPLPLGPVIPRQRTEREDSLAYEVPRLAEYIAGRIRTTLPEQHWDQVLAMVRKRLGH